MPEHDKLTGSNVLTTKGAIHYLTKDQLVLSQNYLKSKIDPKKKIVSFIIGGPNKYYSYSDKVVDSIFANVDKSFIQNNYQAIVIPSIRTPKKIIEKAQNLVK